MATVALTKAFTSYSRYKETPELKLVLQKILKKFKEIHTEDQVRVNAKITELLQDTPGVEFLKSLSTDVDDIIPKIMDHNVDTEHDMEQEEDPLADAIDGIFEPDEEEFSRINKILKDNLDRVRTWDGFEDMLMNADEAFYTLIDAQTIDEAEEIFVNLKEAETEALEEVKVPVPAVKVPPAPAVKVPPPAPAVKVPPPAPAVKVPPPAPAVKVPAPVQVPGGPFKPIIRLPPNKVKPLLPLVDKFEVGTVVYIKEDNLDLSLYDKVFLAENLGPSKLLIVDVKACADNIYPIIFRIHRTLTKEHVLKFIVDGIKSIISDGYQCASVSNNYTVKAYENKPRYCYISLE